MRRIETVVCDRVGNADTISICALQCSVVQLPYNCKAAEKWLAEANALLFREADDLDGEWESASLQLFDDGNAEDDSEDTVIGSGVGNGVQVRADDNARCTGSRTLRQSADVAYCIDSDCHFGCFHPLAKQRVDGVHGRRQETACDLAWNFGASGDLTAAGDDPSGAIYVCYCHRCLFANDLRFATNPSFDISMRFIGRNEDLV